MSRVTHPCTNTLMYSYSCSNNTHTGLFGEMDGDLTKEGVWGYYSLAANGKWLQEECRVVKELCSKLQDSGYGATGQVYFTTSTTNNFVNISFLLSWTSPER